MTQSPTHRTPTHRSQKNPTQSDSKSSANEADTRKIDSTFPVGLPPTATFGGPKNEGKWCTSGGFSSARMVCPCKSAPRVLPRCPCSWLLLLDLCKLHRSHSEGFSPLSSIRPNLQPPPGLLGNIPQPNNYHFGMVGKRCPINDKSN